MDETTTELVPVTEIETTPELSPILVGRYTPAVEAVGSLPFPLKVCVP